VQGSASEIGFLLFCEQQSRRTNATSSLALASLRIQCWCRLRTANGGTPTWKSSLRNVLPFSHSPGVRDIYDQLGYILVEVPCLAAERRAEFILKSLSHA